MQELLKTIQVKVNDRIFIKDPESSEIGRKIVKASIKMIHKMGLESFTFKKLAQELGTTESTIYRYFENKHKLLMYLNAWFWGWLEYEIVLMTANIADPVAKLRKSIETICDPIQNGLDHDYLDLRPLYEIVIEESQKAFLTKEVDLQNKNGLFANFKRINERLIQNINEINPEFTFANTLTSVVVNSSIQQRFIAQHFPSLTDIDKQGSNLGSFLSEIVLKTIKSK